MHEKILVIIPALALGFFFMPRLALGFFFMPGQNYQTIQVFNINATAPLGLTPDHGVLYSFTVPDDAKNIYLKGSVSVSGGAVNTITISLYDASQCPPP